VVNSWHRAQSRGVEFELGAALGAVACAPCSALPSRPRIDTPRLEGRPLVYERHESQGLGVADHTTTF
jgi:hypothetical protein